MRTTTTTTTVLHAAGTLWSTLAWTLAAAHFAAAHAGKMYARAPATEIATVGAFLAWGVLVGCYHGISLLTRNSRRNKPGTHALVLAALLIFGAIVVPWLTARRAAATVDALRAWRAASTVRRGTQADRHRGAATRLPDGTLVFFDTDQLAALREAGATLVAAIVLGWVCLANLAASLAVVVFRAGRGRWGVPVCEGEEGMTMARPGAATRAGKTIEEDQGARVPSSAGSTASTAVSG